MISLNIVLECKPIEPATVTSESDLCSYVRLSATKHRRPARPEESITRRDARCLTHHLGGGGGG